ncbi:MAG: tRNA lysidine(34) synthetase TilS [Clostridiales bacterium]|nr:tRNA lysidine(34) synthetase TilS [Clostridiales bacterium]
MEDVIDFIKKHHMIKSGEIIGVACSGGRDSICLLHFLNSIKEQLDFEVVAVNVDHGIRQNSALDTQFVVDFCKQHGIRSYKFKGEALRVAKEEKLTVEQAARKVRYGIFETVIKKGLVDKIALAHHMNDQAETILLNIIRGTGLSGARGMEPVRDEIYIRPFLNTDRAEIMAYLDEHSLEYVEDESNQDNSFSRNYIRNVVMPSIRKHFGVIDRNIVNFASICAKDDDYINSQINMGTMIETADTVKIPLSYFYQDEAIVNRILRKVLSKFSRHDIESKHIRIVKDFALESQNGNMITLPFKIKVLKEYDFIVFGNIKKKVVTGEYPFRSGKLKVDGYGIIRSTSSKVLTEPKIHQHIIDADRLPTKAVWRFRKEGDVFSPLGLGGSKKLKDYFIDKKIPQRMRGEIPVLAVDNKVLIVGDIEISDEIKVTDKTIHFYKINYEKDLI